MLYSRAIRAYNSNSHLRQFFTDILHLYGFQMEEPNNQINLIIDNIGLSQSKKTNPLPKKSLNHFLKLLSFNPEILKK